MPVEMAGKLGRIQRPREHLFGVGAPKRSTQHGSRAVSSVLACVVGVMVLHVVVLPPGSGEPAGSPARCAHSRTRGLLAFSESRTTFLHSSARAPQDRCVLCGYQAC